MSTTDKKPDPTEVVTGKVRISYAYLLKPRPLGEDDPEGAKPKYGCMLLIKKDAEGRKTKKALEAAIEAAKEKDKGQWGGKIPKNLKVTLRDGDEEGDEDEKPELLDHWFINVSSVRRPGIVSRSMEPLTEEDEVYSGMYARVSLRAYGYKAKGNNGVTFALNHLQKLADGEFLGGGRTKVEDVFEAMDDEDDEDDDIL